MEDTQSTSTEDKVPAPLVDPISVQVHNPVIQVSHQVVRNLRIIQTKAAEDVGNIETHLKRDMGFLVSMAQTFATRLMPAELKEELMAFVEQIKQRHSL